jgi:hypothetical protein
MADAGYQNLHNIAQTLLPWTEFHCPLGLSFAHWICKWCSSGTWPLLLVWCLPLALPLSTWWMCQLQQIDIWILLIPWLECRQCRFQNCKGLGEIDRPKRISILRCLLLEELTIFTLGDDFHHVILNRGPVETMPESLAYDRSLWWVWSTDTAVNFLKQLNAFFSRDTPHHHAIGASSIQYPVY